MDVAIFVAVDSGSETLLAWKESGGFAGTFSPNAAFLQAYYSMTSGHTYQFALQWKTNKPGSSTFFAGAGPLRNPAEISPYEAADSDYDLASVCYFIDRPGLTL